MNKKKLAIILSKLKQIDTPDVSLEQYQTDSEIAASILWAAYMNGDISGKIVADFGCGNGVFGIGCIILGAKKVYFLEIDRKAISVLKENLTGLKQDYDILNKDVQNFNLFVDTVIENPPFGVQKIHNDRKFLETSFKCANIIYSIHKIESRNFIEKISKDNGFKVIKAMKIKFLLKKSMKFHKKDKYYVDAACWVLKRIKDDQ